MQDVPGAFRQHRTLGRDQGLGQEEALIKCRDGAYLPVPPNPRRCPPGTLFDCRCPMKCQPQSEGSCGAFSRSSCKERRGRRAGACEKDSPCTWASSPELGKKQEV